MSKLLVVFGATGNQGGSVINYVLASPTLSTQYKIRGITRNTQSAASKALTARGVEMVTCDVTSTASIHAALASAHTIFAMIAGDYNTSTAAAELAQGRAIIDTALAHSAAYLVLSTLPSITATSGGTLTHAWPFDVKAAIETYAREHAARLPAAFFSPGSFMSNFHTAYKPRPDPQNPGSFVLPSIEDPDSRHMPLVDIPSDAGKYVGLVLGDPDRYAGKTLYGAAGLYTWTEIAEVLSRVSGKTVRHKRIPESVFRGFMNQVRGDELCDMINNRQRFGFWGQDTVAGVEWSRGQVEAAGQRLVGLEEYLRANPVDF